MTTTTPMTTTTTTPMPPARLPTGAGTIGWLGPVLAALLVGVAVVLGQDAVQRFRGSSRTWLASATSALDGLTASTALAVVGVVVVLLGLWLLLSALRPRARDAVAVAGGSGVHVRTADVARLAARAAQDVDGVLDARCSATRRRATVTVTATSAGSAVSGQVRAAAERAVSALEPPPRVVVRTTTSRTDPEGAGS